LPKPYSFFSVSMVILSQSKKWNVDIDLIVQQTNMWIKKETKDIWFTIKIQKIFEVIKHKHVFVLFCPVLQLRWNNIYWQTINKLCVYSVYPTFTPLEAINLVKKWMKTCNYKIYNAFFFRTITIIKLKYSFTSEKKIEVLITMQL
jgi:hypothetical protein